MKTGIRRKVDDLGRVVIPAGIRRSLGIREGDALEVHVDGEQVVLSKPTDQCIFCGDTEDLADFRGRPMCLVCIGAVGLLGDSLRSPAPAPVPPTDDRSRWPTDEPVRPTRDPATHPPAAFAESRGQDRASRADESTTAW